MIKEIVYEFKKLTKEFLITVIVGLILVIGMNAYSITNTAWELPVEMWVFGLDPLVLILPLFVSIPFCFKLSHEIKDGYLKNVFNRINIKHYLKAKFITGAIATYLSVFLIYFISFIVSQYLLPMTPAGLNDPYNLALGYSFLDYLRFDTPFLYGLFISVWAPLLSLLYYTITFNLAFISRNIFVVLTGAFVYALVENFIASILMVPHISMITAFLHTRPQMITYWNSFSSLIGIGICLIFIAILTYFRKKNDLYN